MTGLAAAWVFRGYNRPSLAEPQVANPPLAASGGSTS
jgi:hypothetical protein